MTRIGMRLALTVAWVVAAWSSADLVHAQIASQPACQNVMAPRTTVFFVNGITTTLDDARLNIGKLELEFLNRLPGMSEAVQANCNVFSLNYNPTGGEVNDFFEAAQQQERRREHEGEQDGERQRQQHVAPDIERGDDDGGDEQALQDRRSLIRGFDEGGERRARLHGGVSLADRGPRRNGRRVSVPVGAANHIRSVSA